MAQSSRASVRVRTPKPDPLIAAMVEAGDTSTPSPTARIVVNGLGAAAIGDLAAGLGIALHELAPHAASLEEAFMELTHESVEFRAEDGAVTDAAGHRGTGVTVAAAPARRSLPPGHYRFSGALRSEWTKIRTVRSTAWCVLATVVAGIGIGHPRHRQRGVALAQRRRRRQGAVRPHQLSLTGLVFGQLAMGVLGVLTISAEYGSGSIRATLAAIPRRPVVLGAKALVFGVVALVVSEAVSFASFFVGQAHPVGLDPDRDAVRP